MNINEVRKEKKVKKEISFHGTVRVRSSLHLDDMTEEEISSTWYSHGEKIGMKESIVRDLERWSSIPESSPLNKKEIFTNHYGFNYNKSDLFTIRGIEYHTKKEIRRHNKDVSINAVLNEQEIQSICGLLDHEAIRDVYLKQGGRRCGVEAANIGGYDAHEAERVYRENMESKGGEEEKEEYEPNFRNNDEEIGKRGIMFNKLCVKTFHRKRKVIEELKILLYQWEKQQAEQKWERQLAEQKKQQQEYFPSTSSRRISFFL